MNIFICDPGLNTFGSHHYNYTKSIADEFTRLGFATKIYVHRKCETHLVDKLGAVPHFRHHTYKKHDAARPFDEEENWFTGNESFQRDMERLTSEVTQRNAIVIVPAVTQHQIDGLARWFEALPSERQPRLAISLMFSPQWTAWRDRAVRGTEYYARAIQRLKPWLAKSVLLYTETPEASSYYEQLAGAHIAVLPIPLARIKCFARARSHGRIRFGYMGHSRREKGFHLLPAAIDICQRRRLPFDFIVHIHPDNDPALIAAGKELRVQSRVQSNVSTIIGDLDPERHYRLLDSCDSILLPYEPYRYRARGSALFAEAIAYGKPLVITAGTVMENSANRGECVAKICKFNPTDLARAMREVFSHFGEMETQAKIAGRRWSEANGVGAFCRRIINFATGASDQAILINDQTTETVQMSPNFDLPEVRHGEEVRVGDGPVRIPMQMSFVAYGLRLSRGLIVDAGLGHTSVQSNPVTVRIELNGHVLSPIVVSGGRRAYRIAGPFLFLKQGLPTVLRIEIVSKTRRRSSVAPLLYGFHFLPPAWYRRFTRPELYAGVFKIKTAAPKGRASGAL